MEKITIQKTDTGIYLSYADEEEPSINYGVELCANYGNTWHKSYNNNVTSSPFCLSISSRKEDKWLETTVPLTDEAMRAIAEYYFKVKDELNLK